MTKIFTLITAILFSHFLLLGQIDQVSVGEGYTYQAFYKISTGEVTQVENDSWDIAFSNAGTQDGGVFINESATFMSAPLELYLAQTLDWSESITNTSHFVDSLRLYNPKQNWTEGALNSIKDPDNPFDYGWGAYNPQSHTVEGDKIFVLKKRDETFIKIQVLHLLGGEYLFRYANLDGSEEKTAIASKNEAGEHPLIYFSFTSNSGVEMPTDYDLAFQRYTVPLDAGGGVILQYTVTGILLAPGVEAVVADSVDVDMVNEADYKDMYSSHPQTIGHDWKYFDFEQGWLIQENRAQFVKTKNGDRYKIVFYDFEGSATGITTLEKNLVNTTSVGDLIREDLDIIVYPNPSSDHFYIKTTDHLDIKLEMYSASGQRMMNRNLESNQLVEIPPSFQNGIYFLKIQEGKRISNKTLVIHR